MNTFLVVGSFVSLPLIWACSVAWHELGHGLMFWFETKRKPVFFWEKGDIVLDLSGLDVFARNRVLAAGVVLGFVVGLFCVRLLWGWHYGLNFLVSWCFVFLYVWGCMFDVVELLKNIKD